MVCRDPRWLNHSGESSLVLTSFDYPSLRRHQTVRSQVWTSVWPHLLNIILLFGLELCRELLSCLAHCVKRQDTKQSLNGLTYNQMGLFHFLHKGTLDSTLFPARRGVWFSSFSSPNRGSSSAATHPQQGAFICWNAAPIGGVYLLQNSPKKGMFAAELSAHKGHVCYWIFCT